jgi:hypothetical protein
VRFPIVRRRTVTNADAKFEHRRFLFFAGVTALEVHRRCTAWSARGYTIDAGIVAHRVNDPIFLPQPWRPTGERSKAQQGAIPVIATGNTHPGETAQGRRNAIRYIVDVEVLIVLNTRRGGADRAQHAGPDVVDDDRLVAGRPEA